jgi:two-component system NarL family sensor kinase
MAGTAATSRSGGVRMRTAARLPVWLLAAGVTVAVLAVAIAVGLPLVDDTDTVLGRVSVVCFVVGMTALALTGAVLLQRDKASRMGWILVATGLAGLVSRLVAGALVAAVQAGIDVPAGWLWLVNWVWVPAQFAFLELLLRFPTGRLPGPLWRVVEWAAAGWTLVAVAVLSLVPGPLGADPLAHVQNPFGVGEVPGLLTSALGPVFLVGNALVVVCCAAPVVRWIRGGAEVRQQLRWVLAAVVFLAMAAPVAALGGVLELLEAAAFLALPAAIAVAVLREGLWGLGRAVRRTLVSATATAVLASGYLLIVLTVDLPAAPVIAAVIVAALALPVRNVAQRLLERVLFGSRGDPERALEQLSASLRQPTDSPAATLVRTVAEIMRSPRVAIEDAAGRLIVESGPLPADDPQVERIPLAAGGIQEGWLVVAERAPGEGLDDTDMRLLDRIAAQAGLVIHADRLAGEVRTSYSRLVAVREEERARLQRELHDGIGPVLAGIVLKSEAARNLARNDAATMPEGDARRLDGVLEAIGSDAEAMTRDVRRIIDELRPVSLRADGLATAVGDAVRRLAPGLDAHLEVPSDLDLGEDAELAVYRVTTEAVRNAFQHARARRLSVRIGERDGTVSVAVEDDGLGMDGSRPGVGMRSMRERVEALGGTFAVGPAARGRGTLVTARIPEVGP